MLHHFVCWYVKCVEKVPFRKSGHIYSMYKQEKYVNKKLDLQKKKSVHSI